MDLSALLSRPTRPALASVPDGSAPVAIAAPCAGADPDGLRVDYQRPAVEAAMGFCTGADREGVLEIFTGGGKTKTGAVFVKTWLRANPGKRALWVVPRIFLGDEARRRLATELGEPVALERAEFEALRAVQHGAARVVVGSMQTLKDGGKRERLSEWPRDAFGIIVWDESQTWDGEAAEALKAHFAGAKIIGLSATPTTGKTIYRRDVMWAMDEGYFVRPIPREHVLKGLDLSKMVSRRNSDGVMDLPRNALEEAIEKEAANIVDGIHKWAGDRLHRLTYTPGVASAHAVAAMLNDICPGSAVSCDSKTPIPEREAQLRAFNRGEIRDLVNCRIYGFGLDVPICDNINICCPTEDWNWYMQQVGRGGRPAPGIGELPTREERLAAIAASSKPNFLLCDMTGEAGKHSLCGALDMDREASAAVKARARDAVKKNPSVNVYDALKDAKAWERGENERIAKRAREIKVLSAGGPFDPFKKAGIGNREAYNRIANRFPGPCTEAQGWRLRKLGFDAHEIGAISKGEAMKLIGQDEQWERDGRASTSQRKKLAAKGLPHDLTQKQAADLLWECQLAARTGGVPPLAVVERIVLGNREPGQEG